MPSDKPLLPSDPITTLPGIGPTTKTKLARLDIVSIRDLLHHYPTRFLDYRRRVKIKDLSPKTEVSFQATLGEPKRFATKTGKLITTVTAADQTGKISLTWFNNPYISRLIKPGSDYLIAGKTSFFTDRLTLISPTIEPAENQSLHTHGLVPIYPLTAGVTSRFLRQKIKLALSKITVPDTLNNQIPASLALPSYATALTAIHFPERPTEQVAADRRLAFNHHLLTNLKNLAEIKKLPPSPILTIDQTLHRRLIESLPFKLTPGQLTAIKKSYLDLTRADFTHRLIQGETGSGKTVVAFFLAAQALATKHSFCLLAPTEILASQHYQTFLKLGLPEKQTMLITAKSPLAKTPTKPTVFVGTHALLSQLPHKLTFPLAATVIDEQHKFGVKQREELIDRRPTPHLFNLTATPIPRTLALGLFGEVAVTSLMTKPSRRQPVKTWVLDQNHFTKSDAWLKEQINSGSKIFVVAPTIKDSAEREGAEKLHRLYQKKFAPLTEVFLIHGQMKSDAIDQTLTSFKRIKGGILVATTIIEVGIDIPEADVIIIHHADRFGLATLHQLRGRVGRANRPGYCLLVSAADEESVTDRLGLLAKYHSGLALAKMDLRLRGAGELFGEKQHGWLPVRLQHFWNRTLFKQAKAVAAELLAQNEAKALTIASNLASW